MALPNGISTELKRQHMGSNRNGHHTKAAAARAREAAPRRMPPGGETDPGVVTAPVLLDSLVEIDHHGDVHAPEVWARVEGFLAGWYLSHPELRPWQPSLFVYQRDKLETLLLEAGAPPPMPQPQSALPKPKQATGGTRVMLREGVKVYDLDFVAWLPDALVVKSRAGKRWEISREQLCGDLLLGKLMVFGEKPAWAQTPEERRAESGPLPARAVPKPPPASVSFRSSNYRGGGWIAFAGEIRDWRWVMTHCLCAHCGASVGQRMSDEIAPGKASRSLFYQCDGAEGHVLKGEGDLRWKGDGFTPGLNPGVEGREYDAGAVLEAYPDLVAVPDDDPPY